MQSLINRSKKAAEKPAGLISGSKAKASGSGAKNDSFGRGGGSRFFGLLPHELVFLAVLALVFVFFAGKICISAAREGALLSRDTYYGAVIDGIDLSKLTKDEAKDALELAHSERVRDTVLSIDVNGVEKTVKLIDLLPSFNSESVLEEAWDIGRDGSRGERLRAIYASLGCSKSFETRCVLDNDRINEFADRLSGEIAEAAVEAEILVNPDSDGRSDRFIETKEKAGIELDREMLVLAIKDAAKGGSTSIKAVTRETTPSVTLEELRKNVELVSAFTTRYSYISSRVYNIHRATDTLNGTEIMPGEEFSFNGIVGNTSLEENGYKEWYVIIGGRSEMDRGGGVCQAATTLYNAAVRCDMDITARDPHRIASSYVPRGQDATIAYGACDLRFINTSSYPIYIFGYYTDTSVTFEIWGSPMKDGVTIDMESELLATHSPGSPMVTTDYSLPNTYSETTLSALNGYDVRVYKIWYDAEGNEIKRVVDHEDSYPARRAEVTVGGAVPAPTPTAVPTPTPEPPAAEPEI